MRLRFIHVCLTLTLRFYHSITEIRVSRSFYLVRGISGWKFFKNVVLLYEIGIGCSLITGLLCMQASFEKDMMRREMEQ